MKTSLRVGLRLAWRFTLIWLIETGVIILLGMRFYGVTLETLPSSQMIVSAAVLALVLSFANSLISPAIIVVRVPLNVLTIGISAIFANGALLYLAARQLPGLDIQPFLPTAVVAALLMAVINSILTALIALDDEYTYFQFALHVFSRDRNLRRALLKPQGTPGIIIIQIDGLAPPYLDQALCKGYIPFLSQILQNNSHSLARFDCGLPSQTSAAQAGIMYGNNDNIPGFRWYDKHNGRMMVSNHPADANLINDAVSTGAGLLFGGSSINNLINGDAAHSLLTLSTLTAPTRVPTVRALDDLSTFWFNPYTFTRTVAGMIIDLVAEITQALRQWIRNERPRMDRLFSGQLFMRVLTNIFFRDLSAYVVMLDICRGVPIIYTTFMGYDQVAHHVGPQTNDALKTLRGLDHALRHIQQTTRLFAPFPYQLVVLSDHGQSFGATFQQRYGLSLRDLVDKLTASSITVAGTQDDDDKQSYIYALVDELNAASANMQSLPGSRFRRASLRQAAQTLAHTTTATQMEESASLRSHIIVCPSGNLAHIYLDSFKHKVPLALIEQQHPGRICSLVNHPGIGVVCGYLVNGEVLAFGKQGARNLTTGVLTGADPMSSFGNVEIQADQLQRVAEFENSGDLIINGTLYDDGTVASFENLIGVHGGLGGNQTKAFIITPVEWNVNTDDIYCTTQLHELIARHRVRGE